MKHPAAVILLVAALFVGSCQTLTAGQSSDRLTMQPISLATAAAGVGQDSSSSPERFSGYFRLNHTAEAHMFFFLFQAREDPDNAPVVLWMTGGPGCSSELAVFYENGPWRINPDLTVSETEFGWDRSAWMIFVDQPINTGFSYSDDDNDRCYDEACVSNDMLDFMQALYAARPELQKRPFYVTGESYAGHYVPAVASRLWHANAAGELEINVAGLAIGNGLTDPAIQYGAYPDFALQEGLISQGLHDRMMMLYPACRLALEVCDGIDWAVECELAVDFCQATMFAPILAVNPGVNVYDYRKQCQGQLCYDFSLLQEYINQPKVRKALGVGKRRWEACTESVHSDMMGDWGHSFDGVLPELLAANVRVMVYAGDKDIICNIVGNRRWVDALQWGRAEEWAEAQDQTWEVDGQEAGQVSEVGPLSFVRVYDAGHMVPMDRAAEAYDMIKKFIHGESLVPSGQNRSGPKGGAQATLSLSGRRQGPFSVQQ